MTAWLAAYTKRLLLKPAVWLALLLLPTAALLARGAAAKPAQGISVGLLSCEDACIKEAQAELLAADAGELLRFYTFDDAKVMEHAVATGELSVAYSFADDFTKRYLQDEADGAIERIAPPQDITAPLVDETVFAAVFKAVAPDMAATFAGDYENIPETERAHAKVLAAQAYREYDAVVKTVFTYSTLDGKAAAAPTSATFPVRGVGAALVLLSALMGGQSALRDEEKGLYARLSPAGRRLAAFYGCFLPALLMVLALLASNAIFGWNGMLLELGSALALLFGSLALAQLCAALCRHSSAMTFLLPLTALFTLALCPVFFDLSAFVPAARFVSFILPPYWYLSAGLQAASLVWACALFLMFVAAALLIQRFSRTRSR